MIDDQKLDASLPTVHELVSRRPEAQPHPSSGANRTLVEAFARPDAPTVYKAVVRWMKTQNR
ncbi:hypothetical protein ABZ935_39440 [Streptomyces coeruleorubidus]|uniref:hypothetical protein n=1 Tax=Streptomyces coeruleorubidus TaxID=116188 RepID=UPI0033ECBB40